MSRTALEAQWRERIADICRTGHYKLAETKIVNDILALLLEIQAETQTNSVAWVINIIDEMHELARINDESVFKGIKNTLRDRYKTETGIDPAPTYPIKAHLTHPKGDV